MPGGAVAGPAGMSPGRSGRAGGVTLGRNRLHRLQYRAGTLDGFIAGTRLERADAIFERLVIRGRSPESPCPRGLPGRCGTGEGQLQLTWTTSAAW